MSRDIAHDKAQYCGRINRHWTNKNLVLIFDLKIFCHLFELFWIYRGKLTDTGENVKKWTRYFLSAESKILASTFERFCPYRLKFFKISHLF